MFIYVIGEPRKTLVKIGLAANVKTRLSNLRTGSPVPLQLRAHWVGDADDEARLHDAFRKRRRHGEWFEFKDADPVRAVTEQLGRRPEPPVKDAAGYSNGYPITGPERPPWAAPEDVASVTGSNRIWWDEEQYPGRWPGESKSHFFSRIMPDFDWGPAPTDYGMTPAGMPCDVNGVPLFARHLCSRGCTCEASTPQTLDDPAVAAAVLETIQARVDGRHPRYGDDY